ncbi:MAG: ketoacyl-ACP synthase III [Deltaproteobacteria bacterium]|nr:ketoacyl-ACP synthase III [Deltaproteobacteria bacterium]
MAKSEFKGISIRGIGAAVPGNTISILEDHTFCPAPDRKKISDLTGVLSYRKAGDGLCTSDLCVGAAKALLDGLGTDPKTIDAVVFATMTPDYKAPSTACVLQDRLGLSHSVVAYDINMGCSGYMVGLYNACSLIQGAGLKRVLLLAGDTQTRLCHDKDKNVVFLLGDGGTATLLENDPEAVQPIKIELFTDGSRFRNLYVPAGGFRTPSTEATREVHERTDGGLRSDDHLYMDGMEIFKFSSTDVVRSIQDFMDAEGISSNDMDYLVLHQANKFMNDKIARKLKFPPEKVAYSIAVYGNTGSASIPLTITHRFKEMKTGKNIRCLLSGFGVGLSWGVADLTLNGIYCPPVVEL